MTSTDSEAIEIIRRWDDERQQAYEEGYAQHLPTCESLWQQLKELIREPRQGGALYNDGYNNT